MNYEEAVSYINELQMFARKHTLDHTRTFLSYLGTPQEKKKMIHVAGTNGKGSVCRYLQALLIGEGKRTGNCRNGQGSYRQCRMRSGWLWNREPPFFFQNAV